MKPEHVKPSVPEYLKRLSLRLAAKALYRSGLTERLPAITPWQIVRYERVTDPGKEAYPLRRSGYVRPETFVRHLEYLQSKCNVVDIYELLDLLQAGQKPKPRTVVLTFDGGYRDAFETVLPLLRRFSLPAVFFVSTAYIGTSQLFWQDKLAWALLALGECGLEFPKFSFLEPEFFKSLREFSPEEKLSPAAVALLINDLELRPQEQRLAAIGAVLAAAADLKLMPPERTFMTWDEVRELQRAGYRVGAFGHRHARFNELSAAELASDLREAARVFADERVTYSEVIALPDGAVNYAAAEKLQELGVRVLLGRGYNYSKLKLHSPLIVPRKDVCESLSFSPELFAAGLWFEPLVKFWLQ